MPRTLIPHGGNDKVYTPPELCEYIVKRFLPLMVEKPDCSILEPCAGTHNFTRVFSVYGLKWEHCEIDEGIDFYEWNKRNDWIITNPPYSLFTDFLRKSLSVADNIVFLCSVNALFFKSRTRLLQENNFGIRSIEYVATPPKPWPQSGIQLGIIHLQKNWKGPTIIC